jgi:3-methyladenine DNA glycosylase AlkC
MIKSYLDQQQNNWREYCNNFLLAENPNTSPEILEQLASDESFYVRRCVASHPNTPPKVLEQLATDEEYYVRWSVALNPNTPRYLKKYLKIQEHLKTL